MSSGSAAALALAVTIAVTPVGATQAPAPAAGQDAPSGEASLARPADVPLASGHAAIVYSLDRAADRVDLDIVNAKGATVAGWTGTTGPRAPATQADRLSLPVELTRAGTHQVTWDLHATGYLGPGKAGLPGRFVAGPAVPPGNYTALLTVRGRTLRQPFSVIVDPATTPEAQAAAEARFDLAMTARGAASAASVAIARARAVQARVEARLRASVDPALQEAGHGLSRRLAAIEGAGGTGQPGGLLPAHDRLAALLRELDAGPRPTEAQAESVRSLAADVQAGVTALNALLTGSFARFERAGPATAAGATRPTRAPTDTVYAVGDPGVSIPKVVREARPPYRGWPFTLRQSGTVTLTAVVETDGTVGDVKVLRPLHPDLDKAAVAAAREWRYQPGMKDGKPVPVLISMDFTFSVNDKGK